MPSRILSGFIPAFLCAVLIGCSDPPPESGSGTGSGSTGADSPASAEADDSLGTPVESFDGFDDDEDDGAMTDDSAAEDQADGTPSGDGAAEQGDETESSAPDTSAADAPQPTDGQTQDSAEPAEKITAGDWPMWGGTPSRNMVNSTTGIHLDFEPPVSGEGGKRVRWTVPLGSQTYGNPVVAEGRVFVGTNNGGEYRPQHVGDRGVVLCFSEDDGTMLWQLTREKLAAGRVNDWPEQGICSTPCVENGRLYVVTNRCELMCVDIEGFHDGENDGPYTEEVDREELDADIVWILDMIDELGVFPHNLATSSPLIHGDLVLLTTSNGVDEAHLEVPSPRAPSFIAVNKNTGQVVWEADFPSMDSRAPERFANILHGQWSSPALITVNGQALVLMPGGDGILYALQAETGELVWWFDLNPKETVWELGGRGTRNAIISTPMAAGTDVVLAVGQDPEHGEGVGHLYRIDATKTGDISPQIADGDGWKDNPNSGQIWHYGGVDRDGSITGQPEELIFRRTMSSFSLADGRLYAADLSGFLHCLDYETGRRKWVHDTFAAVWGSPMVVDGVVMLGDEDGELVILKAGDEEEEITTLQFDSAIYSTPTIANGTLFISDRSRLYAFDIQ